MKHFELNSLMANEYYMFIPKHIPVFFVVLTAK